MILVYYFDRKLNKIGDGSVLILNWLMLMIQLISEKYFSIEIMVFSDLLLVKYNESEVGKINCRLKCE